MERTLRRMHGADAQALARAREQMTQLRKEMAGPGATGLETLLTERIAVCQLHLDAVELEYAKAFDEDSRQALQKRITQAHNRFVSAVKALASVKKMRLPDVQVNIGQKQINLAGVEAQAASVALSAFELPSLPAGAAFVLEEKQAEAGERS